VNLGGVYGDAEQNVLFNVEMLYVHHKLLISLLLVLEIDLSLVDTESELFLDQLFFEILHFCLLIEEERVEAAIGSGILECRLFWVSLVIESVDEEHAD
jgi:hypothetical protein